MEFSKNRVSRPRHSLKLLLSSGCLALALVSCAPVVHRHGYVFDDVDTSLFKRNETTLADVTALLGTPTITSTIDKRAVYYISSRIEAYTFYKPVETDRHVLALFFDDTQKLTDYAEYGLKDGNIIAFVERETETSGRELSFLEQIFGNLGRFDSGPAAGPGTR